MNFLRKFFDKPTKIDENVNVSQHANDAPKDSSSGVFDAVRPENVEAIVAIVPKGAPEPTFAGGRESYVWHVYHAQNPEMYRAISDIVAKGQEKVTGIYHESECLHTDSPPTCDPLLDLRKHTNIPTEHSFYVQCLDVMNGPFGPGKVHLVTVIATSKPVCVICGDPLVPAQTLG